MSRQQPKKRIKKRSQGSRGGRPKLDETELRAGRIGVSVNEEEDSIIGDKAATYHMSKAFFLRQLGLGHKMRRPIPAINFAAHRELGKIGVNLNKLVMLINEGRQVGINAESLERVHELVQSTRRALLGGEDGDWKDQ